MSVVDHVRVLLRSREPAVLTERQAVAALRPYGQGVRAAPASPPLTSKTPAVGEPAGVLGEREFGRVSSDFTSH